MLTTNPLIAFVITLAFITINSLRYRISPFFPLMGGAVPGCAGVTPLFFGCP